MSPAEPVGVVHVQRHLNTHEKDKVMSLLDSLIGAATSGQQTANTSGGTAGGTRDGIDPQMLIGIVSTLVNNAGGVSGLLAKLQQGGLA